MVDGGTTRLSCRAAAHFNPVPSPVINRASALALGHVAQFTW